MAEHRARTPEEIAEELIHSVALSPKTQSARRRWVSATVTLKDSADNVTFANLGSRFTAIADLQRAYRERRRTKTRLQDCPEVRDMYAAGLRLRQHNPRMTWEQIAARLVVPFGTWKHWRARFLRASGENGTI